MKMKKWFQLLVCFLAIWIFIKSVPLLVSLSEEYTNFIEVSVRRDLNVTGLFYSEVPETFMAEKNLQKSNELHR